jgi:hypothetical protein
MTNENGWICDSCGSKISANDGWGLGNNGCWFRREFVMRATVHACSDSCAKAISDPNTVGKAKIGTWEVGK